MGERLDVGGPDDAGDRLGVLVHRLGWCHLAGHDIFHRRVDLQRDLGIGRKGRPEVGVRQKLGGPGHVGRRVFVKRQRGRVFPRGEVDDQVVIKRDVVLVAHILDEIPRQRLVFRVSADGPRPSAGQRRVSGRLPVFGRHRGIA